MSGIRLKTHRRSIPKKKHHTHSNLQKIQSFKFMFVRILSTFDFPNDWPSDLND